MPLKAVTDASFNTDVLTSDRLVLVHFWAASNAGSRIVRPTLQEIANDNADTLSVVELNVEENPVTPRAYEVLSIPTMNLYRDGEVVVRMVGAKPKAAILNELDGYL